MVKRGSHFLFLLGLFLTVESFASPQSQSLTQKGYQSLTKQKYEQALKDLEAATQVDPNDGQALFFQGVTLNRLGKFDQAAQVLDQSKKFGTHPDWNFERGWSHLGLGEWKKALHALKEFDKKNPGRGQAAEFIGRAYFGLGDHKKAEKYLKQALVRDENLKETVNHYLALNSSAKEKKEKPDQKKEEAKKWSINSNLGGVFNTNAINLGNGATRPTDISRQESGLGAVSLTGNYRFDISEESQLSLGHQFLSNLFEVSTRLNMLDNYSFLRFRHAFDKSKVLGITVSNALTLIRTAKFRDQIGLQPVFGWRLKDWLVSELSYAFGYGEYFFPSNANQNRDGHQHTASLGNYFSIPKTKLRLRLGYSHLWNRADGADFDYQTNGLVFAASHPLFWEVRGEFVFAQAWNRYANVNSLTANTRRSDDVSNIFVQFNLPVIGDLNGYLRAGYIRNKSNIGTFNYRSQQGGLGFTMGI